MADCTRRRGAARRGAAAVQRANGERAWVRCTRKVHPDARDVRRACSAGYARGVEAPRAGCSPPAAGPERAAPHRCEGAACGAERSEEEGAPFGAADQGCERREGHDQQREVGDELELLRGVAVRRVVGRTRIGVRVDVEEAVDAVDVGEERHAAPVPGKEYQKQQGAYVFQSFTHRTDGLGAKICFFLRNGAPGGPFSAAGAHFLPNQAFRKGKDSGVGSGSQTPLFGIFRRGRRAGRRDSRAG